MNIHSVSTRCAMLALVACALFATGCGRDRVLEDGKLYTTKGVLSSPGKSRRVVYEPIIGNIVWGALLCETVAAPIYFYGFSMYQPVRLRDSLERLED